MAIIGKIRKHSGLAVIIIGVAIAAFVIGDFGTKRMKGTNEIGKVNGEVITYIDFNAKVDQTIETQKENSGSDKLNDQEAYQIRQSTWNTMVRDLLMNEEYDQLGLMVSPEELFDQVQGKQPHKYILQYFKDPKTNQYDPALVLNYLKNLDQMEPKAKEQWLLFEKAIKDDRIQTKFNNLVSKGYYVPKAFLKKEYLMQAKTLKVRYISPPLTTISDSSVIITDADYQKFYDKNIGFFYQDEAYRDMDFVVFEVVASPGDQEKTTREVNDLYNDFLTSLNPLTFANANSDKKFDTTFVKKGILPGKLDSLMFTYSVGAFVAPLQFNNTWYMGKLLSIEERPDSMKGNQILISYAGAGNESIKRTKEQAKFKADSLLLVLKKNPDQFMAIARNVSDYPSAKDDGGELKWFMDGNLNLSVFFNDGIGMKPKDMKVIETRIGYAIFELTEKTKPVKKVKTAILARDIEPSSQTYQETYMKASAFAGQNKTSEAFDKVAVQMGLRKRQAPGVREMDNSLMGLQSAREIVRWAYAEATKVGEVSPVFDIQGKYVIAILKGASQKGLQPLESVKPRIEMAVKNAKKTEMLAERMKKEMANTKDLYVLAARFNTKVDTSVFSFEGFNRSAFAREGKLLGTLFTLKKGELLGPLTGDYSTFALIIDQINEAPGKEDFTYEWSQMQQNFEGLMNNGLYAAIEKSAKIVDNRMRFY